MGLGCSPIREDARRAEIVAWGLGNGRAEWCTHGARRISGALHAQQLGREAPNCSWWMPANGSRLDEEEADTVLTGSTPRQIRPTRGAHKANGQLNETMQPDFRHLPHKSAARALQFRQYPRSHPHPRCFWHAPPAVDSETNRIRSCTDSLPARRWLSSPHPATRGRYSPFARLANDGTSPPPAAPCAAAPGPRPAASGARRPPQMPAPPRPRPACARPRAAAPPAALPSIEDTCATWTLEWVWKDLIWEVMPKRLKQKRATSSYIQQLNCKVVHVCQPCLYGRWILLKLSSSDSTLRASYCTGLAWYRVWLNLYCSQLMQYITCAVCYLWILPVWDDDSFDVGGAEQDKYTAYDENRAGWVLEIGLEIGRARRSYHAATVQYHIAVSYKTHPSTTERHSE